MRALGRRASSDLDGFVKILADAESDEILESHDWRKIIDLISEAVVAMEYRASAEDIVEYPAHQPSQKLLRRPRLLQPKIERFIYKPYFVHFYIFVLNK